MAAVGVVGGCSNKKTSSVPRSESVADITPPPAPAPTYQPAPQPVAQPVVYDSINTSSGTGSVAGGSYTVKKGDTLYGIAKNRYGDGKAWTRIASANPGLKPETLKAGQTIVIP